VANEDLEPLRCPKDCNPAFLQYLTWEGTQLRICAQHRQQNQYGTWHDVVDIGLRCGDCGTQFHRKAAPYRSKVALDQVLADNQHVLSDFKDEIDDAWLRTQLG
jgi:hypothetical protein